MVVGLVLSAAWRYGSGKLLERDTDKRIDRLAATFFVQLGNVVLWLVVLTVYAHVVPALNRLGTVLLTGVSIAGVVVGVAAQSTLGNLIAGVSLIFYKPFRLGDRIQITNATGTETGIVETVSLGFTFLRTDDNRRVVLSNSLISSQVIVNLTMVDPRVIATVPFSIGYGADIAKARAIVLDQAKRCVRAEDIVDCRVVALGASDVDLAMRIWSADSEASARLRSELLEAIAEGLAKGEIEMPIACRKFDAPN